VNVKPGKADAFAEKLTYTVSTDGTVVLVWGDYKISFEVK
jgi:hypothetical protein